LVNGTKVIQGEWFLFETRNLMQPASDIVPPAYIEGVRVYASGWDWESAITDIAILVEE
jgi:hypothetical protein